MGHGLKLEEAIRQAQELDAQRRESGFDQDALDKAARLGFANGMFEESEEDVPAIVEEFYPEDKSGGPPPPSVIAPPKSLKEKLDRKAAA